MCGRYVSPDEAAIERHFRLRPRDLRLFIRRFNVAPTMAIPIVVSDGEHWSLLSARWGYIPSWWKETQAPTRTHLARSEDLWTRPMWRTAIRRSRCLIPMEGWYEWQESRPPEQGATRPTKRKQPYFIHPTHGSIVAVAGLLDRWQTATGEELLSCAALSRASTDRLSFVHDRMPVVLDEEGSMAWLSAHTSMDEIRALMSTMTIELNYHAVSLRGNNTRNDDEELISAIGHAL